jgi:hypothetical protein
VTRALGVVIAGALVALGLSATRAAAEVVDLVVKANPVDVTVTTSSGLSETAINTLFDTLASAPAHARFSSLRSGSGQARDRLIKAIKDGTFAVGGPRLAISGSPLTDAETNTLTTAKQTLVSMPVHAVNAAVLLSGPGKGAGFATSRLDENGIEVPGPVDELDGPHPTVHASMFKLPWSNFAAMYLEVTGPNIWDDPGLLSLWGYTLDPADGRYHRGSSPYYFTYQGLKPWFSARFEKAATNLYVQTAVARAAPGSWSAYFQTQSSLSTPPSPSESYLAGSKSTWRANGVQGLVAHLDDPDGSARASSVPSQTGGTMAVAPVWVVDKTIANSSNPGILKLWVAELPNKAGEWVAPTTESISKAVAAGGETPLYALDNPVPGGYPLTWVESVLAPAKGLTIDETNAVAAFVRLLVTDGQDVVAKDSDGVISPALVTKTLNQLNGVVQTNCDAAGGSSVSSKDSPYYPPAAQAPKLAALDAQNVCATKVPVVTTTTTTTTTTAPTTTSTTAATTTTTSTTAAVTSDTASPSQGSSSQTRSAPAARTTATTRQANAGTTASPTSTVSTLGATTSTTRPGTTTATTASPQNDASGDVVLARAVLPLGLPSPGGGFDRLTTMLMGSALLLAVRRAVLKRRRRVA